MCRQARPPNCQGMPGGRHCPRCLLFSDELSKPRGEVGCSTTERKQELPEPTQPVTFPQGAPTTSTLGFTQNFFVPFPMEYETCYASGARGPGSESFPANPRPCSSGFPWACLQGSMKRGPQLVRMAQDRPPRAAAGPSSGSGPRRGRTGAPGNPAPHGCAQRRGRESSNRSPALALWLLPCV